MRSAENSDAGQALLEQLIAAVSRLARPAEGQTAYLRAFAVGNSADELALEFDDVRDAALPLLTVEQRRSVLALDEQLAAMSGLENADVWSHDALITSDSWTHVRAFARNALASLHSEPVIPA